MYYLLMVTGAMSLGQCSDATGLPAGATVLSASDYNGLLNGTLSWNTATQATVPFIAPQQTLAQAQSAQLDIVSNNASAAIVGGINSSALGSAYTYPSTPTDQMNLTANVVASLMPSGQVAGWLTPQMCRNQSGVWGYQMHTAAQIQQVGNDVKNAIASILVAKAQKDIAIMAATTIAAVQGVV
ncbi:hypothetical protein UFOVP138_44 [uncultured Caudovirales phage]|uniref:DUF4376 domain-containing protein n=1 Tax=uncultured Caudovirales phage TaxID=2100421 RepID=A0A6J5LCX9_9CAUD|nr:hypothetical protein UFOVP138_44 [uncultured Caudovirales phage]